MQSNKGNNATPESVTRRSTSKFKINYFEFLPPELINIEIVKYLDNISLHNLLATSKTVNNMISEEIMKKRRKKYYSRFDTTSLGSGTALLKPYGVTIGGNPFIIKSETNFMSNLVGNRSMVSGVLPAITSTTTIKGTIRIAIPTPVHVGSFSTGVCIPANSIVTNGFYDVVTTFTSRTNSAIVSIGIDKDDPNGILEPVSINDPLNPFNVGYKPIKQNNTIANFSSKTIKERAIIVTVENENLNEGKLVLFLEFVTSEN